MAFLHEYPYTDMHELNLDWILKAIKDLQAEWLATKTQFDTYEAAWLATKEYIDNYFENLNVQTEINNKLNALVEDGTMSTLIAPFVQAQSGPIVVTSVSSMTDPTKLYVLSPSGVLYSYNSVSEEFVSSGIVYGELNELTNLKNDLNKIAYKSKNLVGPDVNSFFPISISSSNPYLTISTKSGAAPAYNAVIIFYDENLNEVGSYSYKPEHGPSRTYQVYTNYKYARWDRDTSTDLRQVEYGQVKTTYTDYDIHVADYVVDYITGNTELNSRNLVGVETNKYYKIRFSDDITILTLRTKSGNIPTVNAVLYFYDENLNELGSYAFGPNQSFYRLVPIYSTYAYAKWDVDTTEDLRQVEAGAVWHDYVDYVERGFAKSKESPLSGKTWNAVGDSITEGYYGDPNQSYVPLVAEALGVTARNYGEGGTTLAINNSGPQQNFSFVERVCGLNGNPTLPQADVWSICGGVNDSLYNSPLGTIDSTELTTIYGALKKMCEYIQAQSNNPKILFMTPTQSLQNGQYMDNVCKAIKEVAAKYSIPVLDLNGASGISFSNLAALTHDNLHPNAAGYNMYYNKIVTAIKGM